jgi:hypothetical protein
MRGRHWGLKRISPRPLSQRNYSQWRVANCGLAEWLTTAPAECLTSGYKTRIVFQTPHECRRPSPSFRPT